MENIQRDIHYLSYEALIDLSYLIVFDIIDIKI